MPDSFPKSDIDLIIQKADLIAARLVRTLALPGHCVDDIRQELLADLAARLGKYDPARGDLAALAYKVCVHRSSELARSIARERAVFVPMPETTNPDIITTTFEDPPGEFPQPERHIDIERALRLLTPADLEVCCDLLASTPTQMCREKGWSRSALYRRRREIALTLRSAGISSETRNDVHALNTNF